MLNPYHMNYLIRTQVVIKDERIKCPEALFNPLMLGKNIKGYREACYDAIQKWDEDIRKEPYNNIVLCGGNSMSDGLSSRLIIYFFY